jgi:hypothetical protein
MYHMAASIQFFYHARAWSNLQTCAECIWNTLWISWISPAHFLREAEAEKSSTKTNSTLIDEDAYDWKPLFISSMRLMDMLDMLEYSTIYDDADVLSRATDTVDVESQPVATAATLKAALQKSNADIAWIVKFVMYTIQVILYHNLVL